VIADRLNIGKETVRRIVTVDLGKRKICVRFVPRALTTEQKQERVVYCQDLLLMGQDESFWGKYHYRWRNMVFHLLSGHQTTECRVGGVKFSKTKETAISKIASEDDVNFFFSKQKV